MNSTCLQLVGSESSYSGLRRIIVSSFPLVSHESSCGSALNPAESSYVASRPELGDSKSAAFSPHNQLQLLGVRRIKASGFQLAGVESNCSELRRRKVSGY